MSLSCVNHLTLMDFGVSKLVRIKDLPKRVFARAISFNKTVSFVQTIGGHGGRVVTLLSLTTEAKVWFYPS